MSEKQIRKPNLNQILQSQKLLTEVGLLQSVISFLHGRICVANAVPVYGMPGFNPGVPIPRPVYMGFPGVRPGSGRSPSFFQPSVGMEEQADMGMGDYRMPPNLHNMFAPHQEHVLNVLPQVFNTDPEKITVEQLEKIAAGLQDIQKQILDMMSEASINNSEQK